MKIKAFNAMYPDPEWYNKLMNGTNKQSLRYLLEPERHNYPAMEVCKINLATLIDNGQYKLDNSPGIYIYEKETAYGSQFGVWTLTSLDDMINEHIVTHEGTLQLQEEKLTQYRESVGLEASPIVLTYRRDWAMSKLIEKVSAFAPIITLSLGTTRHKVWKIRSEESIKEFEAVFHNIERVYVADGHHRLAAAAMAHRHRPQWISTLYITVGQIECREFHRIIRPKSYLSSTLLLEHIGKYFFISPVPGNVPYKPTKLHRFGMHYKGNWYQLDLNPDLKNLSTEMDVQILQEKILNPLFGIENPATDARLRNIPANKWEQLLEIVKVEKQVVTFTLFPITADALIQQAEKKQDLPPKSTYIEPKVPFGLLLYQNELTEKTLQEYHL